MADNQYRKYLEENRYQEDKSSLGTTAFVGGAIGLAATAIVAPHKLEQAAGKMTSGVIRASRFLGESTGLSGRLQSAGAFTRALDFALDNRSMVSHFRNTERFDNRFRHEYARQLNGIERGGQSTLGGTPTRIEERFSELRSNLRMGQMMHERALQFDQILKDLKVKMPSVFDRNLQGMLTQQNDEFFTDPTEHKILGMLERYTPDAAAQNKLAYQMQFENDAKKSQFVNQMLSTLKTHKGLASFDKKTIRGTKPDADVQGYRQLRKSIIDGFKQDNEVKNNFFTRMMNEAGYKQLTVEDALKRGLFDKDSLRKMNRRGEFRDANTGRGLEWLGKADKDVMGLAVDPFLYIGKKGDLLDARSVGKGTFNTLSYIQQNFQVPFLRFNPLDLAHWTTIQSVKEAPSAYFFRRGTIQPYLQGSVKTVGHPSAINQDAAAMPLAQDYMYAGGRVYDVTTGDVVKEGTYLASARFGMVPRAAASMANLHREDYTNRSFLGKLFDVGRQESESIYSRMASTVTKFNDEDWEVNTYRLLHSDKHVSDKDGNLNVDFVEKSYKNIYAFLNQHTTAMSDDVASFLNPYVQKAYQGVGIDLTKLRTEEEIMSALGRIGAGIADKDSAVVTGTLNDEIVQMAHQYRTNATDFRNTKRVLSDNATYMTEPISVFDQHETALLGKVYDAKRLIHQHALQQLSEREGLTVGRLISQGINDGAINKEAVDQVRDLNVLTELRGFWNDVYKGSPQDKGMALIDFTNSVRRTDNNFTSNLYDSIRSKSSYYSMGPGQPPPQYFGLVGYTAVNEAKGYRWAIENANKLMTQGYNPLDAGIKSAFDVIKQPFAGRGNLGDVTTATLPFYYFAERLDNALAKTGLGLSQKNRGSMQSILANQFGRRIVLPYMALQQLNYFDDLTGDFTSDNLADAYVNMNMDVARFKEFTGLNSIGRHIASLLPGIDQLGKSPIGAALRIGTFGFIGENRSDEELDQYYRHGEEAIRKGRFWGIGSNTPWEGGQIDRFQPNWYRRLKSDYQYTDTMYGSDSEYWANNWMPTLTHPLAPLRHFLFDPDHWANKHKEDRPYPVTGGISEFESIPLVGSLINNTLGRILNPLHENGDLAKAHRQYLEEVNARTATQYESSMGGGYMQLMPSGGFQLFTGGSGGYGSGVAAAAQGEATGVGYGGGGAGGGDTYNVGSYSRDELTAINMGFTKGVGMSPAKGITSIDDLRDPDTIADLRDIGNPYGAGVGLEDSFYSLTEMAGIYGFGLNTLLGYKDSARGMSIDKASRMTSYSRAWWDLEMGGLGGDLSEIFRRYNPRDTKQYYNPIRNTMPDWLPGSDYYTDFLHGDPYTKVKAGEMRLPGEAYKTLNQLHPDNFGEYGAFDRFKILADIAPYSDQYKFWRRMVSQMNQAGMLDEEMNNEYADVRDQVAQRKKKYHLYPYKYKNAADVLKEQVTVTEMIDQNTFLTVEYPNNPIRLAGIKIKSDDKEAQELLSQVVHPGAKVTIGLDSDPLFRVRDDMYNTMRAVVYSPGLDTDGGIASGFGTKGQSLNGIIARRKFGAFMGMFGGENNVTVNDDGSAVSTAALYDKSDITVGSAWETMVHSIIPNIPIVGTIADKFMQVRSPLEMYKKNEVYGKSWRPWTDPWSGWIQPMLETAASHNPLVAAAQGYGIGWLFGRVGRKQPGATGLLTTGKYLGSRVGAAVFGTIAALRVFDESIGSVTDGEDYAWIPERRQREREINEYFDILKYVKYRGLYEKARQEARRYEGVDVEDIIGGNEDKGGKNKDRKELLAGAKKWLNIHSKLGYVDEDTAKLRLKTINQEIDAISGDKEMLALGPRAMQAMQYRLQYESTLYGVDPNGDMTKIFRALPSKDREFFTHFINASPEERQEILKLVPKDQRKLYQAKWGMDVDERPNLDRYFLTHNLPSAGWEGWKAETSLDSIKVKVVRNEGLELTEFGYWQDDEQRANQSGVDPIPMATPSMFIDPMRLEKILRGAGLHDVTVSMDVAPSKDGHAFNVVMDVLRDRKNDIVNEINNNLGSLV